MKTMNDKTIDRVRKLLELTHSANEHEAALAASRAAALMSEHAITEAMLEVVGEDDAAQAETRAREGIVEQRLPDAPERKVAWRDRIAVAVCRSLDGHDYPLDERPARPYSGITMKRTDLLALLKFAGYHADRAAFTRLAVEHRISVVAAGQAYARGIEARKAGQRCGCGDCASEAAS